MLSTQIYELPADKIIFDSVNIADFDTWAQTASEADIDSAIAIVRLVYHRRMAPPPVRRQRTGESLVTILRPDLNREFILRYEYCDKEECEDCELDVPDITDFRWVGPWTCPACIGPVGMTGPELQHQYNSCTCHRHGWPWTRTGVNE